MRVVIGQRYDCTMKVIINIILLLRCLSTTLPHGTCGLKWESLKSAEIFMLPSLLGFRTCPAWQVNVFTDFFVFFFHYFHPGCPSLSLSLSFFIFTQAALISLPLLSTFVPPLLEPRIVITTTATEVQHRHPLFPTAAAVAVMLTT